MLWRKKIRLAGSRWRIRTGACCNGPCLRAAKRGDKSSPSPQGTASHGKTSIFLGTKVERVGGFQNIHGLHRVLTLSWGTKASLWLWSMMKRRGLTREARVPQLVTSRTSIPSKSLHCYKPAPPPYNPNKFSGSSALSCATIVPRSKTVYYFVCKCSNFASVQ